MWRSKPVVFRQGHLDRVSRDFYQFSPVIRLKVDGEFFFACLPQFQNIEGTLETVERLEALSKAEPGLEVFLGAHRLDDGSFWLHWLKCPGRLDLLPLPPDQVVGMARKKLATWTGLMLLALLFAAMLIFGAKTGGALVAGSFMFCGAFICGCVAFDGLAVLLNKASPEDKAARLGLESLEAALSSGRPWQTPGLGPASADQPPDIPLDLPPGLGVSRVDHAVVHEQFIRRPTLRGGSLTLKYLIYDFMVDGEPVSWPVGDKTSNLAEMPAFRRAHPPFLAPGDMVLTLTRGRLGLVVRANMPTISHKPVLELFNLTDRSACPSETDFKGALPYLYLGALVTILSVPVMVAEVAFFSSSREGLGAVLEALHSLVDFLPNGFLAMGGLVLIVEAAIATNNDPEMVAGRRNWRLLASSLKRRTALARLCGVFWERFSPWRIWITLAVTLVSFLLTYQS